VVDTSLVDDALELLDELLELVEGSPSLSVLEDEELEELDSVGVLE
jgi:hypothetical protein